MKRAIQSHAPDQEVSLGVPNFNSHAYKRGLHLAIKRAVNWLLHFFGYHLTHYPKPYKRRTNQLDLPLSEKKEENGPSNASP